MFVDIDIFGDGGIIDDGLPSDGDVFNDIGIGGDVIMDFPIPNDICPLEDDIPEFSELREMEEAMDVSKSFSSERLDDLLRELDCEIISARDFALTDEMLTNAVSKACAFFNIPEVEVINADGTCVWPRDPSTYDDDILGFNRNELMTLGVSGEDSLTLIYTHECAHRTLQGAYNDPWEEELACDFFAGVNAGMNNINLDNFEAALGSTSGCDTHPHGALRADFIEFGKNIAQQMKANGVEVTYENCLAQCNIHLAEKSGIINEYRAKI